MSDIYIYKIRKFFHENRTRHDAIAKKYRDLFQMKVTDTNIDMKDVLERSGILFREFDYSNNVDPTVEINFNHVRSFSQVTEGKPYIFYHKELPEKQIKFELAHQLGHFLMHFPHDPANGVWKTCSSDEKTKIEEEAINFAYDFLCHSVALEYYAQQLLGSHRIIDELSDIFGLTKVRIAKQLRRYNMI
jgi:Zn-dependent peptidase ImmA (M78 family)